MSLVRTPHWPMLLMAGMIFTMYSIFLLDADSVYRLTREDGLVETAGALLFLVASIVFGMVYLHRVGARHELTDPTRVGRRNVFHLLLCLLFLLAFLEEISWGQRVFGIETPAAIRQLNRQGEINIHNLRWFHGHDESGNRKSFLELLINGDRILSMFWFSYCVCIPLLGRYSQRMRAACANIRLPVVPLAYAFLFPLNYLMSRVVTLMYPAYQHNIVETKETVCSFLFLCVALGYIRPMFQGVVPRADCESQVPRGKQLLAGQAD